MPDTLESRRTKRGAQGYGGLNEGELQSTIFRTIPNPNPNGGPTCTEVKVKLRETT